MVVMGIVAFLFFLTGVFVFIYIPVCILGRPTLTRERLRRVIPRVPDADGSSLWAVYILTGLVGVMLVVFLILAKAGVQPFLFVFMVSGSLLAVVHSLYAQATGTFPCITRYGLRYAYHEKAHIKRTIGVVLTVGMSHMLAAVLAAAIFFK